MDEKTCKLFLEADKLFRSNQVDMTKINKLPSIKEHCPKNKPCKNNMQGISALSAYLFMKLEAYANDEHGAYFLMWLSDKLFKTHNRGKGKGKRKKNDITLNLAYNKYLDKHKGNFNYWILLYNINGLKEANLEHMHKFYKLLNYICKTIVDYKKYGAKSKSLIQYSTESSNQYMFLYENVSKCNSYLHLLGKLKKIYDNFRASAITQNITDKNLSANLQTLTTKDKADLDIATNAKEFHFNDTGCRLQYDDDIFTTLENAKIQEKQKYDKTKGIDITLGLQLKNYGDQIASKKLVPGNKGTTPNITSSESTSETDTLTDTKGKLGESQDKSGIQGSEPKDSDKGPGGSKSEIMGPGVENGNMNGEVKEPGDPNGGKGSQISTGDASGGEPGGTNDLQDDDGGEGGGSDDVPVDQGGANTEGGALGTQSASWVPFDIGSYVYRIASKGMEQLNNASNFITAHKTKIIGAIDNIRELYNTSVSNIKTAYKISNTIFNHFISNLSIDFKKVEISDNSGDKKPVSKDTGDGLPTLNDSPSTQENPPQTSSGASNTSLSSPNPKEQTKTQQSPQKSSEKGNFNKKQSQQENQQPVSTPMIKQEDTGIGIQVNGITEIGDIYALKEYKQFAISIIVLLIPVTLVIMYKYLSSGWRKEMKRKKNMKKVINSIGGKRQMQIIIKSVDTKKMENPIINPVCGEKKSLLNICKFMQADPVPFINLFFLLIFFIYKRTRGSIEL
ncbi:PIR protein CIR protein [Plasmodium vinckei]|uniref:PIR protein CIR protein n=1 Tax=Plasmodium vinckei TaxID=5860 RepID=A0A6V7SEN8_PLAVN|nr:PIR protein CIR protein [Plasmodium vinckei]